MSLLGKLKSMIKGQRTRGTASNPVGDDLPDLEGDIGARTEEAAQATNEKKSFRVRENPAPEKEGIPSVNRGRGHKTVTVLSLIVAVGVAGMLVVNANSDKTAVKKRKNEDEARITNNLPPLVVPPEPPPINVAAQSPLVAQPFLPQGQPRATGLDGKPVLHWTERKLSGSLLVGTQSGNGGPGAQPAPLSVHGAPVENNEAAADTALGANLVPTVTKSVTASTLANRNFLITKGTTLDCALETALDSSLPGLATCRLTRDVYSDNGNVVLLDRGSQLVGEYQGGIKQGQVRVFVLWTRAKTPNGVVVSLESPGTDALGRTGVEGWVDNHFLERFGAAILMTFIKDAVTALVGRSTNTSNPFFGTRPTAGERVVDRILESQVNIPPTIIKNQGEHIQVMVARDLDFSGVYGLQVKK